MRAININVDELLNILNLLKSNNVDMVDLDITQDESNPNMKKLVLHPVKDNENTTLKYNNFLPNSTTNKIEIRDPDFNTENNDIFNSFEDIL